MLYRPLSRFTQQRICLSVKWKQNLESIFYTPPYQRLSKYILAVYKF